MNLLPPNPPPLLPNPSLFPNPRPSPKVSFFLEKAESEDGFIFIYSGMLWNLVKSRSGPPSPKGLLSNDEVGAYLFGSGLAPKEELKLLLLLGSPNRFLFEKLSSLLDGLDIFLLGFSSVSRKDSSKLEFWLKLYFLELTGNVLVSSHMIDSSSFYWEKYGFS